MKKSYVSGESANQHGIQKVEAIHIGLYHKTVLINTWKKHCVSRETAHQNAT